MPIFLEVARQNLLLQLRGRLFLALLGLYPAGLHHASQLCFGAGGTLLEQLHVARKVVTLGLRPGVLGLGGVCLVGFEGASVDDLDPTAVRHRYLRVAGLRRLAAPD